MHDVGEDWLKKLAKQAGYKSLRALALAVHRKAKFKRERETLANKVRDANKRKDLEWWTGKGRDPVLDALAEELGLDREELLARMREQVVAPASGIGLWPFTLFPALRPLDLRLEPPFPGVPSELLLPGGPKAQKVWWVARPGAGKTLVGRILERRYGWTYVQASSWRQVPVPLQGSVFIELESTESLSIEALEALPAEAKVCIASPLRPPGRQPPPGQLAEAPPPELAPKGFQILVTPPAEQWTLELIDWVETRLDSGGGFSGAEVREAFARSGHGWFGTPGELLGFFGLIDEVGTQPLLGSPKKGMDPSRWIKVWLRAAADRHDRRCPPGVADLLRQRGADILVQMEIDRRFRDLGGFAGGLPRGTWIDLVPRQIAPEIDRERLLSALDAGGETAVRQALVPDGASVVSGLEAVGALVPVIDGVLMMGPNWLWSSVRSMAQMRLAKDAPRGLGTLLLSPVSALLGCAELIQDAVDGEFDRISRCLAESPVTPEQMVAVDAAFRALGLAIAGGATVPLELGRLAWERQMAHVAQRYTDWPPVPIVAVASPSPPLSDLRHVGTWFFAALHLSRWLVGHGVALQPSALNPWSGELEAGERTKCGAALYAAASALARYYGGEGRGEFPLSMALHRLGGDLLDRCGVLDQALSRAQGPDALVLLARGALKVPLQAHLLDTLVQFPWGLSAVEGACARRGVPLQEVVTWAWTHWMTRIWQSPPWEWLKSTPEDREHAKKLWEMAPVSELPPELVEKIGAREEAWPCFTEALWTRWLQIWAGKPFRHGDGEKAFQGMPEHLALRALRDGSIDPWCHDSRKILWQRMPGAMLAMVDELASAPPVPYPGQPQHVPILDLVYSAPEAHVPALVERARAWTATPDRYPSIGDWLRGWLMRTIEQRSPGWRTAFEMLTKVLAFSSTSHGLT